jgi:hypothetical protein
MRAPFPTKTLLAMTILASAYAPAAMAQVVGETGPNIKLFSNSKDVLALIDKVKTERKEGQPLIATPILTLAPYRASLEYRAAKAPAAVHETEAEMMYVIEGTGTIVTGGKLVDEKRNNPENLSGTDISGGSAQAISKGDFLIVPQKYAAPDRARRRRADHPDDAARAAQDDGAVGARDAEFGGARSLPRLREREKEARSIAFAPEFRQAVRGPRIWAKLTTALAPGRGAQPKRRTHRGGLDECAWESARARDHRRSRSCRGATDGGCCHAGGRRRAKLSPRFFRCVAPRLAAVVRAAGVWPRPGH